MNEHISDEVLREVLDSDDEASLNNELKSHVEQCQRCRCRLEELAASKDEWSDAVESLHGVGSLSVASQKHSRQALVQQDLWREYPLEWTESMAKQLLDAPSHPEMLGRIGRYEVERLLGAGGMGIVFKAFDTELSRPVAIKLLAPHLAASGAGRQRFSREAKAAAAIVHEHVVPIYNVETEQEKPFMVMHFISGESLQARLDREGALELCEILRIARQIASGLAAAHAQGLVHRDIKPSNVLLEKGVERALLTDFGLARAADDASLTRTGFHPGTPQYMSPEQARGDAMDARSDLFSLGSVLYVMCTGRAPFRAESSLGILRKITDSEPVPIRELNPAIPEWLERLVERLMAKRIEDRFQSAAEVAAIFEACLAHVQEPLRHSLPKRCQQTFLQRVFSSRRFQRFMNDKKVLSIIGLVLFLAAVLVPFLLAGVAVREEYLLLFAAIAFGFAVVFAVISRKELFSRIVLVFTGAAVVACIVGGLIFIPFVGLRRSQAIMDERRSMEYEAAQVANQELTYSDGRLLPVGRAEWENEYLKLVEGSVAEQKSYTQIVSDLKNYTTQRAYRSLQVEAFGEKALQRDINGNILTEFPNGFLSPMTSERAAAISNELTEKGVAYATMQITVKTIQNSLQPATRPTQGWNGNAGDPSEASALRVIVFFNSEGKSMAFGIDGVYVHGGIGMEKTDQANKTGAEPDSGKKLEPLKKEGSNEASDSRLPPELPPPARDDANTSSDLNTPL